MPDRLACPYCSAPVLDFLAYCPSCGRKIYSEVRSGQSSGDLYHVLQVDPAAEPEVIDAAYKRLATKYHPDVSKAPDAASRMQEINGAYAVLSDPGKRRNYDESRLPPSRAEGHGVPAPTATPNNAPAPPMGRERANEPSPRAPAPPTRPTSPPESVSQNQTSHAAPVGLILGIAVAGVGGALLLVVLGLFVWTNRSEGRLSLPVTITQTAIAASLDLPGMPRLEFDAEKNVPILNGGTATYLSDLAAGGRADEMHAPGTRTFAVKLTGDENTALTFGWCAKTKTILDSNMQHYSAGLSVDGIELPNSRLSQLVQDIPPNTNQTYPEGLHCYTWAVLASRWPSGPHHVVITWAWDAQVNDGYGTYDRGEYAEVYSIMVGDPTSTPTAVPTPTPAGPTISNCYMAKDPNHGVRTSEFTDVQTAYINCEAYGIKADTQVKVSWYVLDMEGFNPKSPIASPLYLGKNLKVDASGNGSIFFLLTPSSHKGWPLGHYRVVVTVDGVQAADLPFLAK